MSKRIEFRVLGPLEVWDGEQRLTLGSDRQRALLGVLLLHPGEAVAGDRLAAAVWGEAPSEQTASALRTDIAAIRRLLQAGREKDAPSVLLSSADGYRLNIDPEQVDLHHFEQLVEQGRRAMELDPVAGSALLHKAVSLWRGPALGDLTLAGAAADECARLQELRMAAVEDRLHADLELGRHAAVVAELEALVAAHPLRERLHAQRMLALHRCGRDADALAAFGEAQRHLTPSPDLQSLELAILSGDPALAAPARARDNTVLATIVPGGGAPVSTATPAPPPMPPAAAVPPPATRRGRPSSTVAGAAALFVGASALGGLAIHSLRASATAQSAPAAAEAFPNHQELVLLDRYASVVTDCHRYPLHYAKALADVECRVRADHPGASSVLLQSFARYDDLEMHFHHVLGLTIQSETGRPVTAAYHGDCGDPGSGFFALANHTRAGAATPNGHLMCYVDHGGVPRLAWTDVSRLTVAQAVGVPGTPADSQAGLLGFWHGLYPDESLPAQLAAAHTDTPPAAAADPQVAPPTDAAPASGPQIAPTPPPSAAPAPAQPAGTRSSTATRTATTPTSGPTSSGGHPAAGGEEHGGSWEKAWHSFFGQGHDGHGHD